MGHMGAGLLFHQGDPTIPSSAFGIFNQIQQTIKKIQVFGRNINYLHGDSVEREKRYQVFAGLFTHQHELDIEYQIPQMKVDSTKAKKHNHLHQVDDICRGIFRIKGIKIKDKEYREYDDFLNNFPDRFAENGIYIILQKIPNTKEILVNLRNVLTVHECRSVDYIESNVRNYYEQILEKSLHESD